MDMSMMSSTFSLSHRTPLYFTAWTPTTTGAYTGTCIFLIFFTIIFRALIAYRHVLGHQWALERRARAPIIIASAGKSEDPSRSDDLASESLPPRREQPSKWEADQWRLSVDVPRASIAVVIIGVGYLLMLAVMTFNVGYFLSVLAGNFLGELALGRFGGHGGIY